MSELRWGTFQIANGHRWPEAPSLVAGYFEDYDHRKTSSPLQKYQKSFIKEINGWTKGKKGGGREEA